MAYEKVSDKVAGLEVELDAMRGSVATLAKQQTDHLEVISRMAADIAELQAAIKMMKLKLESTGLGAHDNQVTRYA